MQSDELYDLLFYRSLFSGAYMTSNMTRQKKKEAERQSLDNGKGVNRLFSVGVSASKNPAYTVHANCGLVS